MGGRWDYTLPLQPAVSTQQVDLTTSLQTAAANFSQLTANRAAGIEAEAAGAVRRATTIDGPWLTPDSSTCLDASGVSDVSTASFAVLSATFEDSFSRTRPAISGGGGTGTAMESTVSATTGDVAAVAAQVPW